MNDFLSLGIAVAIAMAAWVNVDAATGATFGAAFFLLDQGQHPIPRRMVYASISAVMGYAAGLAVGGSITMITAVISSAVAVTALTALVRSIERDGIKAIFDFIRDSRR